VIVFALGVLHIWSVGGGFASASIDHLFPSYMVWVGMFVGAVYGGMYLTSAFLAVLFVLADCGISKLRCVSTACGFESHPLRHEPYGSWLRHPTPRLWMPGHHTGGIMTGHLLSSSSAVSSIMEASSTADASDLLKEILTNTVVRV
jgi:hypothetical protein